MDCIYEKCRYLLHVAVKKLLQRNEQTEIYTLRFSFKTQFKLNSSFLYQITGI